MWGGKGRHILVVSGGCGKLSAVVLRSFPAASPDAWNQKVVAEVGLRKTFGLF